MKGEEIALAVGRAILDAVAQPHDRVLDVGRAAVLATLDAIREPDETVLWELAIYVADSDGMQTKSPLEQWQAIIAVLKREVAG